MRIFAVPAAILLACCLYLPLPRAGDMLTRLIHRGYDASLRLFTSKDGQADEGPALLVFCLLLGGAAALLSAIHPLVSMLLMTPAFTGLCVLPGCAEVKDELDSGKYARDIPAYEALVRENCRALAPAFSRGVVLPMLLGALGMPLHLGAALCAVYTAICALESRQAVLSRITSRLYPIGERLLVAMMLLCAGSVGRNPLRTSGKTIEARLLSILGIAGDGGDTHAPMAGDIPQGIFLCGFASLVLCFLLCAAGFVLCR